MKLSDIGEINLIERFSASFLKDLPPKVLGIGDDCAVIPQTVESSLLITTDALVEDIHFLREHISPQSLGHKALAVNLSDIAGMGGIPHSAFLTLCLPKDLEVSWLDLFFDGFKKLAEKHNVFLLGGDTTGSTEKIVISVTVLGHAHPQQIKYRSQAKPGDLIYVTDTLGDSAAGLQTLLRGFNSNPDAKYFIERHHNPRPHLEQGHYLASLKEVHAMMDVSDGIDSDLFKILKSSRCGAHIDLEKIPLSNSLKHLTNSLEGYSMDITMAIKGGEDYCLIFTRASENQEEFESSYLKRFNSSPYLIGQITDSPEELLYFKNKIQIPISQMGANQTFQHFGENR